MVKVLLLVCLSSIISYRLSTCRPHFVITNTTYYFGVPSIVNGTVWVVDNKSLNILFDVKRDIKSLGIALRIDLSRGNRRFFTVLNETRSYCERMRFIKTNKIWEAIHLTIFDVTNFPQECPIPKNAYYVRNYTFPDSILPAYMPLLSFVTDFMYTSKNRFREKIVLLRFVLSGKVLSN